MSKYTIKKVTRHATWEEIFPTHISDKGPNPNIKNKNKQKTYKAIRKPNRKKWAKDLNRYLRGNPNGYKHVKICLTS